MSTAPSCALVSTARTPRHAHLQFTLIVDWEVDQQPEIKGGPEFDVTATSKPRIRVYHSKAIEIGPRSCCTCNSATPRCNCAIKVVVAESRWNCEACGIQCNSQHQWDRHLSGTATSVAKSTSRSSSSSPDFAPSQYASFQPTQLLYTTMSYTTTHRVPNETARTTSR